jgi:diguanylate cyclase (GGDEF)-like protein
MRDVSSLHSQVFHSLPEPLAVIDHAGTLLETNAAWSRFGLDNGLSSDHAGKGCNFLQLLGASAAAGDGHARDAAQGILDVLGGNVEAFQLEYPCHRAEARRWFLLRISRLKGDARHRHVIAQQDITQRKLAEERAEHLSLHDPLTGLANRRHLDQVMNLEMRRSLRYRSAISLIAVDVDRLKDYNDAFGRTAGDQCLVDVGRALSAFSRRPGDLAARVGADDFALLLGGSNYQQSQKVAEAVRGSLDSLKMFCASGQPVSVSMGAVSVILREEPDEDFLLQEAGEALFRAKLAGRNRVVHTQPVI